MDPDFYNLQYYRIMSNYVNDVLKVGEMSVEHSRSQFESFIADYRLSRDQTNSNFYYNHYQNYSQLSANQRRTQSDATRSFLKEFENIESNIKYWSSETTKLGEFMVKTTTEFYALKKRPELAADVNTPKYKAAAVDYDNCRRLLLCKQKDIVVRAIIINFFVLELKEVIREAKEFIEFCVANPTDAIKDD